MPVIDSKAKRLKYDYRRHYIKHNPGILGRYYVCSQCLKPLKRHTMEVDHIFPNSAWYAPNKVFNCVAICSRCNKKKSNKVTLKYVTFGLTAKALEEVSVVVQKGTVLVVKGVAYGSFFLFDTAVSNLTSGNKKKIFITLFAILMLGWFIRGLF